MGVARSTNRKTTDDSPGWRVALFNSSDAIQAFNGAGSSTSGARAVFASARILSARDETPQANSQHLVTAWTLRCVRRGSENPSPCNRRWSPGTRAGAACSMHSLRGPGPRSTAGASRRRKPLLLQRLQRGERVPPRRWPEPLLRPGRRRNSRCQSGNEAPDALARSPPGRDRRR